MPRPHRKAAGGDAGAQDRTSGVQGGSLTWRAVCGAGCSSAAACASSGPRSAASPRAEWRLANMIRLKGVKRISPARLTSPAWAQSATRCTIRSAVGSGRSFYHDRQMISGNHTLRYNGFLDSSRSLVWRDGAAGTGVLSDALKLTGPSVTKVYVVYGRIMGKQTRLTARTYLDDLIVTQSPIRSRS